MFTFIHAADIHLDSPLLGLDRYEGAPAEEIRGATRRALANLVDSAIEQSVNFVVIAGDVYDGDWQDFHTGLFFVNQMNRLRKAEIPVVLISGNHDAANKMTKSLPLPDNVRVLSVRKPETVTGQELGGQAEKLPVAIHGQGFRSAAVDENVALKYPAAVPGAFNIGVLHTSLETESGGEHARYAPCKIADLVGKGYDYWALGHIHKRQIVHSQPPIVYSGNLQGRHIRETGEKGAMLVSVDDQMNADCEFVPLDVFRWQEVQMDVGGAANASEVIDRAGSTLRDALAELDSIPMAVRLCIHGACAAHGELASDPKLWKNQLRAAALNVAAGEVWIEKIRFQTSPVQDIEPPDSGPILEVIEYVADLKGDESLLTELASELDALGNKLPDELRSADGGQEPLRLDDPEWLRRMLDEVEPLLVARLSSGGTQS